MSSTPHWPYCQLIDHNCIAHEMGVTLSSDVFIRLLDFISTARPGANLSLQRTRDGFQVQVTETTPHRPGDHLNADELHSLAYRLRPSPWDWPGSPR